MFEALSRQNQYFYRDLAKMIKRIEGKKSSIKHEVYNTKSPKRYHAILHRVILNFPLLKEIAEKSAFVEDIELGAAVVYDTLNGTIKNAKYKKLFLDILGDRELKDVSDSVYFRLNTLKGTEEELKDYDIKSTCIPNVFQLTDQKDSSDRRTCRDLRTDINLKNKIKFQNIASCLPSFILNPPENSTVIDATAAPGNKTTHLSSIMNNTGKIYAFEKNKNRFQTMARLVEEYGATNVETKHMDFLKVQPSEFSADYILLDPSCSGSGIHYNYRKDDVRVNMLHNIQSVLIKHALTFNPIKLVYSTCSIHAEEGEEVIKEALEAHPNYEVEKIGDFWKTRGHEGYDFSEKVVRSERSEEEVGFFVALLRRKD